MNKVEYTLIKDMTTYKYPSHMKRPPGFENYHEKWIPKWETHLKHLIGNPNVLGIEIGTLYGDCAVFCAERIVTGENSLHCSIDINNNKYLKNNIAPYKNIKFMKGRSSDFLGNPLLLLSETADYIFIDGSHLAFDIINDAVLSWRILKDGGILIFDDYGWGIHTNDEKQKPKIAIDAFMSAYQGHYQIIEVGWQVYLKKLHCEYSKEELENAVQPEDLDALYQ